jgi:hypothetical protein
VPHFGGQNLGMSSRSEALLDRIADFLKFISNTQSYWFTLNTSYDHGCHLTNRSRLDQKEYEAVLIVAGLANYTRFGFQIKAGTWRKFLGGHWFVADGCTIELAQKRLDLNAYINGTPPSRLTRRDFYVVRIGNKSEDSPNKIEEQIGRDGQLITPPPRLNGLTLKTQSFRQIADPYVWNFLVENNTDDDKDESLSSSSTAVKTTTSSSLLPPPGVPPVPANKKRKLNEDTSSNKDSMSSTDYYPNLSRALG